MIFRNLVLAAILTSACSGCSDSNECPACDGRGLISVWSSYGGSQQVICMKCFGSGKRLNERKPASKPFDHDWRKVWIPLMFVGIWLARCLDRRSSKRKLRK